ncbi:MAG: arginine--tRNA ligase [Anaerolineae bacterium]|nr:arginine--tRNA ligase [Anaerolineae bacterium]
MFEVEQKEIENKILAFCKNQGLPDFSIDWKWIPFSGHWGISFSFFQLAAQDARERGLKINVGERAQEIAQQVKENLGQPAGFERIEAVKGYLNLYFSSAEYSRRVIDAVLENGATFGRGEAKHERVMVEFSQPNTHKAFHVGHLRSAILGDVISRILEFAGYDVVRANYPGDIGLHVIKWLWNYMKFHKGEKPERDVTHWMGSLYAEANKRLEENPDLESEVRALYKLWDQRDPEVVELWKETRQWSLDGFTEMYRSLDIRFDVYYFNSMAEQPGKEVVDELIKKGIAKDERAEGGTVIVKLDELLGLKQEKYRVMVVLRSDSTALYSTEDLALAKIKFGDYPDLVKSYYVVDVRQSLHFQQVFKTLELAGYEWATRCEHIPYELVNLPGNVVMASREGTVVLLEDLIREAVSRALEVVKEKNPDLSDDAKMEIARAVGIAAIKYPMLAREGTKVVTFDWESALDFNGQAAPYIQYAYVRAGSILRRSSGLPGSQPFTGELAPAEVELVDLISRLPREVQRAAAERRPLYLANHAYALAKAFSDFYNTCPVLQAEEAQRSMRLRLTAAARQAIGNALTALGLAAPDIM